MRGRVIARAVARLVRRRTAGPVNRRLARARRGFGTLEILVALWIFLVLTALASALVGMAHRRAASVAGSTHAAAVLRHAAAALGYDLRGRAAGDWIAVDDSTVDLMAPVGAGVVCGAHGANGIVIPAPAAGDEAPLTTLRRAPQAGDVVHLLVPDAAGGHWIAREVTGTGSGSGASCALGALALDTRPPLVLLTSPAPPPVVSGTPLRVTTRLRYSLYRSGDGSWQLGLRRCGAVPTAPCEIVQPLAGPLLAHHADPAKRGLTVEPLAPDGTPLPMADAAQAAVFRVTLRAPRTAARAWTPIPKSGALAADSLVAWVAARNRP